ncbi:MAG: SDR family NAD(P)-dependent oxidoreductase [Gammaproteobacteria bacterium]|nr:SDR family NAD(P)-dependent oxidoreductase [Gammaproteobacteria bacterium]
MAINYANKVVAITGAGKGLGRAYALHLAGLGARIVVNNRTHAGEAESSADRVVAEIVGKGGRAIADYGSVEDSEVGDRLLSAALSHFGRLDCLVANAGVIENSSFRKQTLAGIKEVLDINLTGTVNVVHPVFRHMCDAQRGSIVVSTSSAGLFGEFGLPAYSASKAAVLGLMYSLSIEGARKNVSVNAISPYATTQMTADHLPPAIAERMVPDAVAPVLAWLASGQVSGEIVVAGGGMVGRAGMRTTAAIALEDDHLDWKQLSSLPLAARFPSAGEHFQNFISKSVGGGGV